MISHPLLFKVIGHEIASRTLLTQLWLVGVYLMLAFLEIADELDVNSHFMLILKILAFSVPRMIYELAPMVFLIGTMMALLTLTRNSELIAMQASGLSKTRITKTVFGIAGALALAIFLWGELVVPVSEDIGNNLRTGTAGATDSKSARSIWIRKDDKFLYFESNGTEELQNIEVYQFDRRGRLVKQTEADAGTLNKSTDEVIMNRSRHLRFDNGELISGFETSEVLDFDLEPLALNFHTSDPALLNFFEMIKIIRFLNANGIETDLLTLALWNRLISPLSIFAMAAFAILFSTNSRRHTNTGLLLLGGLMFGLLYYAIQQSAGYWAILNDFSPLLGTVSVLIISLGIAYWFLSKAH